MGSTKWLKQADFSLFTKNISAGPFLGMKRAKVGNKEDEKENQIEVRPFA